MMRVWAATVATLVLAGVVLAGPAPGPIQPWPGLVFVLAALGLELTAVAQPGMGFFSAAPACYLALALLNPKAAILTAVGCIALRTLVKKSDLPGALSDLAPLAVALALFQRLRFGPPAFLLLDLYLPACWLLPELLAQSLERDERRRWARFQHRTRLAWFAVRVAAPALSWPLIPALMALQWAAQRALISYRAEEREELRSRLERSQLATEAAREQATRTRQDLAGAIEESVLKEELARELARTPDYRARLDATLRLAGTLVPFRSAVIFELTEGSLHPVAFQSPDAARLEGSRLLGHDEPIVRTCLKEHRPVPLVEADPNRIMHQESEALAVPLDARTALYVGMNKPMGRQQQHLLQVLASVVGPGLEAAREVEKLALRATRSALLETELQSLEELLEATRSLGATLDRDALLQTLQAAAQKLVPHNSWEVAAPDGPEIACKVAESGRPLLIEDSSTSRFQASEKSLLAVPMRSETRLEGVLLLGRTEVFTRRDLERMKLLALHAGLALSNVRLHQEALDAYERLQRSEAQLVQSSKLAAVGQLAAGVAHELNTPLGAILLAVDSLEGKRADKMLTLARDAAKQARSIVEKLLYYSREGRVGRQPTDLNQVVKDTLLMIGNQLELDQVQVVCRLGEVPEMEVNANEMQQVVTNLILNARDAIMEGPALNREIEVRSGADDGIWLEVRDHGPGIAADVADRVFDPFWTTKPVGRGTGLGLSVSSQIVASHGGRLELCNPGEPGARFRMTL